MFLARRTDLDRWLEQNPLVLGGCALAIGLLLAAWSVGTIRSGQTHTNWGTRVEGGQASLFGVIRLIAGIVLSVFGIYKLLNGLF